MSVSKLTFLGSGDAFGSGGRLQTCMHVTTKEKGSFLIDCGSTAMIGIRKFSINPNDITNIFISHLHGDHFAGIPFFILDAQLVSKRVEPLHIFAPKGSTEKIKLIMETLFPGSFESQKKFAIEITEMLPMQTYTASNALVTAYAVEHSGLNALALRFECDEKIVSYSGDTQWVDALIDCGSEADLFIVEAYYYDRKVKFHLDFASLLENKEKIAAKKYLFTHMNTDMLNKLNNELKEYTCAYDGMVVTI